MTAPNDTNPDQAILDDANRHYVNARILGLEQERFRQQMFLDEALADPHVEPEKDGEVGEISAHRRQIESLDARLEVLRGRRAELPAPTQPPAEDTPPA